MKEDLLKKLQSLSKEELIGVIEWMLEQDEVIKDNPDECPYLHLNEDFLEHQEDTNSVKLPYYCSGSDSLCSWSGEWDFDGCNRENPAECWIFRAIQMTKGL